MCWYYCTPVTVYVLAISEPRDWFYHFPPLVSRVSEPCRWAAPSLKWTCGTSSALLLLRNIRRLLFSMASLTWEACSRDWRRWRKRRRKAKVCGDFIKHWSNSDKSAYTLLNIVRLTSLELSFPQEVGSCIPSDKGTQDKTGHRGRQSRCWCEMAEERTRDSSNWKVRNERGDGNYSHKPH